MDSLRTQVADAHTELEELERIIVNREYKTEQDLKELFAEVKEIVQPSQENIRIEPGRGHQRRQVNGQRDIQRNGSGGTEEGGEA